MTTRTRASLRAWELSGGAEAAGGQPPGPTVSAPGSAASLAGERQRPGQGTSEDSWGIAEGGCGSEKGEVATKRAQEERLRGQEARLLDSACSQSTARLMRSTVLAEDSAWAPLWVKAPPGWLLVLQKFALLKTNVFSFFERGFRWGVRLKILWGLGSHRWSSLKPQKRNWTKIKISKETKQPPQTILPGLGSCILASAVRFEINGVLA